ncbi:LRGUK-like protein, partial [Mya arenaria]
MADDGQYSESPALEDGYVVVNGETHVLNYDTNILNLEDNRDATPGQEIEADNDIPTTTATDSDEEGDDVELSPGGILDENTVGVGLSNLGRSADGTKQVYLHCTIPGYSLIDIQVLANFTELQKVEIPYNEITDLSPLSDLPYLLILNASHNKLSTVLDFKPPRNLKEVDLSFNEIEVISDLSAHHSLMKLNLDKLSLAHNKIGKMQGLNGLPIQYLNLRINFSGNKIRSLKGLQNHDLLESLDLEDNEVIDISEIKFIKEMPMLRQLNLLRNPIQELPDYRLSILFQIQRLTELDRHKVEVDEKVSSMNMFNPPPEVIAARDHIMHVVYSFLQPSRHATKHRDALPHAVFLTLLASPIRKKQLGRTTTLSLRRNECHEQKLQDRGIYSQKQIEYTLSRADMYKTYNQNHPGFFDMMINSDDIQEAYKRLRRLVMDYLGIGLSSPQGSDDGEQPTDAMTRPDTDQNLTTQLGTRTWSRPTGTDMMTSQPFPRSLGDQTPTVSGRGIVEEESLRRRQSAAKEAVVGANPPLMEQLLTSETTMTDRLSLSAPAVNKPLRPGSSDSSENRSGASSSLTGLTSASDIQRGGSPEMAQTGDGAQQNINKGPPLPTEMVNPLELMSETGNEPKPPSGPRPGSQGSRHRPGSSKHKILPPISPKNRP